MPLPVMLAVLVRLMHCGKSRGSNNVPADYTTEHLRVKGRLCEDITVLGRKLGMSIRGGLAEKNAS